MRVISGRLKGKRLFSARGRNLRPTSDRVREAIFDILQSRTPARRILDLFAGTGALGIEALSRGGEQAVFVENHPDSVAALRRNIEACGLAAQAEVLVREVRAGLKSLEARGKSFDLLFLDPPYGKGLALRALQALAESSVADTDALIVAEHSPAEPLEGLRGLQRVDQRKYGGTLVSFFEREKTPANI